MQTSIFDSDVSMPTEVKKAVTDALPRFIKTASDNDVRSASVQIAKAFGDQELFAPIVSPKTPIRDEAEKKLVQSFQKNLELLVQKTWVEKADEAMKEELLFRINTLCGNLSRYDYHTSLAEFLPVLHDVVYLLFGSLAKGESFIEYAVRVDPDFGFFWYYINSLPPHDSWSEDKCRAAVLLGIFFLANF
ncbi:MAG TPA: hypothetical protein PLU93_02995 [Treponemataceae bacterium]|jgi:hypothetical protein|nr:hypothetical protein [Treponemataceae bacterium]